MIVCLGGDALKCVFLSAQVLHCNDLEEMCLNSQSSDGSQFFFPSQQLMGSDFLYMPPGDNLR